MGWHPTQLHITMPWLAWANATHRQVYPVSPQAPKCKEPSDSNENLLHGKFLKHFVSLEGGRSGGVYSPRMFDPWPDRYKVPAPYQTHHCCVPFELDEQAAAADAAAAARVHRFVRKQKKICRINLRRTQSQQQQQFSSQSARRVRDDEESRNTISKSLGFRVSRSGRTTVPYPYSKRCVRASFNRTLSKFELTEAEREHRSEVISSIYRDLT